LKHLLAIDPGDTTGLWHPEFWHLQREAYEAVTWLHHVIDRADYIIDEVVIERMNLRDRRGKSTTNLQRGLDVIGCVRWICSVYAIPIAEQWNRDKNQVSDDLLDEHGMLKTPKTRWRHANDAARHALYRETTLKRKGKW